MIPAPLRLAAYHEMLALALREGRADSAYYLTIAIARVVTDL